MSSRLNPDPGQESIRRTCVHLLDVADVAALYRVSEAAIRRRIRLGQLGPWMRAGRRWVTRRDTFMRWLDQQEAVQGPRGDAIHGAGPRVSHR